MKVEAGQLKTLRKPLEKGTVSFSKLRKSKASIIYYVDDRESRRNGLSVVPEKSDEALKNLSPNEAIPLLELDYSSISDRSLPSSLNDEFLKKNPAGKRA
ncbi:hypothetical protein KIN20_025795 [Parelaphostrongylus tenuis]|uniref:Uncharacterized protein n=1 Tax=Parelaphostrongylus tenuis TaxID=148309 RepID=A0AAD5QX62_PARTN|nr:hypothetical protein KIN20_025795 [Parelaphostrongylus tenuis]